MSDENRSEKPSFITRLPRQLQGISSFLMFTVRRYLGDNMTLAAGALTFSTLLALVPLMVIAFAILSGFSAFDPARARMEAMFFEIFVPEVGAGVGNYLSDFSRNAANLTAVGIVALAFTAVMLLWTIEATLNQIWRVEKPRSIQVRVLIYWTVLTMGPLLLGASFVLTSGTFSTISQWAREGVGGEQAVPTLGVFFAFLSQFLTFTLLFKIIPNRHVRLKDAAIGGAISALGVQTLRWGFDVFLASGSTYETVYGAVAILPIFLFWLYLSWVVVLVGAVCAAAVPEWWKSRDTVPGRVISPAQRLQSAVDILRNLHIQAQRGKTIPFEDLQADIPLDIRDSLFESLLDAGYIVITEDDCVAVLRDLHSTTLADLARDLHLSLGAGTHRVTANGRGTLPAAKRNGAAAVTPDLPEVLHALHLAEAEIMASPLHDLITALPPPERPRVKAGDTLQATAEPAPAEPAAPAPAGAAVVARN